MGLQNGFTTSVKKLAARQPLAGGEGASVVVDGRALDLYVQARAPPGALDAYGRIAAQLAGLLQGVGLRVVVVFDGACPAEKVEVRKARLAQQPPQPPHVGAAVRRALAQVDGVELVQAAREANPVVARHSQQPGCVGVLGDDDEILVFDGVPALIWLRTLEVGPAGQLRAMALPRGKLQAMLKLRSPAQWVALATVMGTDECEAPRSWTDQVTEHFERSVRREAREYVVCAAYAVLSTHKLLRTQDYRERQPKVAASFAVAGEQQGDNPPGHLDGFVRENWAQFGADGLGGLLLEPQPAMVLTTTHEAVFPLLQHVWALVAGRGGPSSVRVVRCVGGEVVDEVVALAPVEVMGEAPAEEQLLAAVAGGAGWEVPLPPPPGAGGLGALQPELWVLACAARWLARECGVDAAAALQPWDGPDAEMPEAHAQMAAAVEAVQVWARCLGLCADVPMCDFGYLAAGSEELAAVVGFASS